jgi:hypothetical protein
VRILDPLFTLHTNYSEMRSAYRRLMEKHPEWAKEFASEKGRMNEIQHYQLCLRRLRGEK